VTVLLSGSGSNLQALIDARNRGQLNLDLVQVISNRADAYGLQRANKAGIPTTVLPHGRFATREAFDQALAELIAEAQPGLVVLAGFMRILGPTVVEKFHRRMINLHPSLLPLYRGTNTYQRALDAGDLEHGASLHFVSAELDGGPLISQVRIPIQAGDTAELLAARLAPREHDLIVSTTGLFCRDLITCRNDQVFCAGKPLPRPLQLQTDGSFLE
jgi:phosphoribosylglycinamide formyltransferase-1